MYLPFFQCGTFFYIPNIPPCFVVNVHANLHHSFGDVIQFMRITGKAILNILKLGKNVAVFLPLEGCYQRLFLLFYLRSASICQSVVFSKQPLITCYSTNTNADNKLWYLYLFNLATLISDKIYSHIKTVHSTSHELPHSIFLGLA